MINRLPVLSRPQKRFAFLVLDSVLVPLGLYLAFALRYGDALPIDALKQSWILFPVMTIQGVGVIYVCKLPRIKLHTFEHRAVLQIGMAALLLCVSGVISSYALGLDAPRSLPLVFGPVFFLAVVTIRLFGLYSVVFLSEQKSGRRSPVIIYGAGAGGIQMAAALRQSREARPVLFVDENPSLHGLMISGLLVYDPSQLAQLIARYQVERVLVAIPSISQERQKALLRTLSILPVDVQTLPSYVDMMAGNLRWDPLSPVHPDQLLGRDKVALDTLEISKAYAGRVVMVTGAGGSIGAELCRQLLECHPAKIVLFEQGEFALYSIDRDLRSRAAKKGIAIATQLGSVTNKARVQSILDDEGVDIILHAAAYKHVPLVEQNELEGARNNVLGTQIVADCAQAAGIERMILVSTDKAVRPTNIMGATKRMAELVIQDIQTRAAETKFAMVRFGNVLGSSGSVLPLFQAQIEAGGPVTVTHTEVTRFFMTIPEAARLVLLAGAYATGGDAFVLDMGQPQKIINIAEQMIALSGRSVKDPVTGQGDIAIEITGLRPGEKLYEELLIDNASLVGTPHPKILRAEEKKLSELEMASMIRELRACIEVGDAARLRQLIEARVDGYHRQDDEVIAHKGHAPTA